MVAFIARIWLPVLLLIAPIAGFSATSGAHRIQDFFTSLKALEATFEQRLYDEQHELIETASGRFYLHRPRRLRWEYLTPYRQQIVTDGKRIWIYDVDLEQVTVRPLNKTLDYTPAAILIENRPFSQDFIVRTLSPKHGLEWIELIPRSEDSGFTAIRVAFNSRGLQRMELVDRFGQLTQLQFTNVIQHPSLDAGLFVFEPPPGVDVFEENDDQ